MHKHVRIFSDPVNQAGTLRHFMPDHPCFRILIFGDESQRRARSIIFTCAQQSLNRDHSIARKKPCVLRPTCSTRWPVPGYQSAAEIWIADPRLIERDLRPRQISIEIRIRSFNLQVPRLQLGIMLGGLFSSWSLVSVSVFTRGFRLVALPSPDATTTEAVRILPPPIGRTVKANPPGVADELGRLKISS